MGAAGGGGTHAADGCYPGGWGAKGEQMDNTTASAFFLWLRRQPQDGR